MLAATACAPPPPAKSTFELRQSEFADLVGWREDDHGAALTAFRRSCTRLAAGGWTADGVAGIAVSATDWQPVCAAAAQTAADGPAARAFFETWFSPHRVSDRGDPRGLFTGYYEAELRGAWRPDTRYRTPIYGRPPGLVTADLGRFNEEWTGRTIAGRIADGRLVPMPTRAEIDAGALAGRGLELLWVDDPVDAFFLHVQGSGRVVMADGRVVRLAYAAPNGRPYVSIGRRLIDMGALRREDVSMQTIRAWLAAHPHQAASVMAANPSFVFFRLVETDDPASGPVGAQGVPLTPGRSLAVDRRFIPLGVPVWLDTADPIAPQRPLRRLVIAQDTGSAIRGAVRGDLFWGFGAAAAERAGTMKAPGSVTVLLPKSTSR